MVPGSNFDRMYLPWELNVVSAVCKSVSLATESRLFGPSELLTSHAEPTWKFIIVCLYN